eukprot:Hpha_TRINITY_DN12839_c0_g1::TRINITY_DN12839_c0_g1_i1::g.24080::m.24080
MASYIEAAAACDWAVVESSPVKVDVVTLKEAEIRRHFKLNRGRPASAGAVSSMRALQGWHPEPSQFQQQTTQQQTTQQQTVEQQTPKQTHAQTPPKPPKRKSPADLQPVAVPCGGICPEARVLKELLEEVISSDGVLMEMSLRRRCQEALGIPVPDESPFCDELPVPNERSQVSVVDTPQGDRQKTVGFSAGFSVAEPQADEEDEDGDEEAPAERPQKRKRTVVRAGNRRFTVTAPSPRAGDLDNDYAESPRTPVGGAQDRWRAMQTRLAEVKLQTMLQTFTPEDGEPVHRVVLTGGPCAGKSTGTALLRETLERNDVNVFCVPEAATLLIGGGCGVIFKECDDDKLFRFQLALLETQLALEDAFLAIAKACGKRGVILCDRGAMDGRAFCSEEIWNRILREGDWTTQELRDGRYDMVLHLVTAADGAEEFYGNETNNVRTETAEQACAQDRNLQKMWTGHPKIKIIDNSTNFSEKMNRTVQPILELCDIDRRPGPYKKYLIEANIDHKEMEEHVHSEAAEVMIQFLRGSKPDNQMRLYQRRDNQHSTYSYQNFRKQAGEVYRVESTLTRAQYVSMQNQVDPSCSRVVRTSQSFVFKNQYMELGSYMEPQARKGETYLWVETSRDQNGDAMAVTLPPFLPCQLVDVTDEGEETDFNLAKGGLSSLAVVALKRKRVLAEAANQQQQSPRGECASGSEPKTRPESAKSTQQAARTNTGDTNRS